MMPNKIFLWAFMVILLAGCTSTVQRAPVFKHAAAEKKAARAIKSPRSKDWRPDYYVVQKGDTLYSIAFNYGIDYHDLAAMNGINDPSLISIGRKVRLFKSKGKDIVAPIAVKPINNLVKGQPKVVKFPYSPAIMARINKVQRETTPYVTIMVAKKNVHQSASASSNLDHFDVSEEPVPGWGLPAKGKLIGKFSEAKNRKGIDIAGKLGDPVMASASGKVVYSGNGLRGYGKLIIIKHNSTYLSAYAHNNRILVKEGQHVSRGQKIAGMGKTDAHRVELHFEVRRFGKPVDPARYLPLGQL